MGRTEIIEGIWMANRKNSAGSVDIYTEAGDIIMEVNHCTETYEIRRMVEEYAGMGIDECDADEIKEAAMKIEG